MCYILKTGESYDFMNHLMYVIFDEVVNQEFHSSWKVCSLCAVDEERSLSVTAVKALIGSVAVLKCSGVMFYTLLHIFHMMGVQVIVDSPAHRFWF